MKALLKKFTGSIIVPIGWTVITIVLLCLPGSALPDEGIFTEIPYFDKFVHVALFGGITMFWSLYFLQKNKKNARRRKIIITIALCTIALGICMEFIQLNYVPNRTFDKEDIIANTVSSIIFGSFFYFKKPGRSSP